MSKITIYNKLVRDKIPEVLEKKGIAYSVRTLETDEYFASLLTKLQEEIVEFTNDTNEEELADILEVLYAIIDEKGFTKESIEAIRIKKVEDRGAFKKKIFLEKTEE